MKKRALLGITALFMTFTIFANNPPLYCPPTLNCDVTYQSCAFDNQNLFFLMPGYQGLIKEKNYIFTSASNQQDAGGWTCGYLGATDKASIMLISSNPVLMATAEVVGKWVFPAYWDPQRDGLTCTSNNTFDCPMALQTNHKK